MQWHAPVGHGDLLWYCALCLLVLVLVWESVRCVKPNHYLLHPNACRCQHVPQETHHKVAMVYTCDFQWVPGMPTFISSKMIDILCTHWHHVNMPVLVIQMPTILELQELLEQRHWSFKLTCHCSQTFMHTEEDTLDLTQNLCFILFWPYHYSWRNVEKA